MSSTSSASAWFSTCRGSKSSHESMTLYFQGSLQCWIFHTCCMQSLNCMTFTILELLQFSKPCTYFRDTRITTIILPCFCLFHRTVIRRGTWCTYVYVLRQTGRKNGLNRSADDHWHLRTYTPQENTISCAPKTLFNYSKRKKSFICAVVNIDETLHASISVKDFMAPLYPVVLVKWC